MNEIEIFAIIVTITLTVLAISVICLTKNLRRLKEKFDSFSELSTIVQSHLMKKVNSDADEILVDVLTNLINALKEETE